MSAAENDPGKGRQTPAATLDRAFQEVVRLAEASANWYMTRSRGKRLGARLCRLGAILLGAAAGILPVISELTSGPGGSRIRPAYASVALAVAATLIGLDRFFGLSTAWMRFISAEMRLRHMVEELRIDWIGETTSWAAAGPSGEQIRGGFARLQTFLGRVHSVVLEETNAWISEFQQALAQIDEQVKATTASSAIGAVNLTVSNGDKCTDGWTLSLDGGPARAARGKSAAIRDVAPGLHHVQIAGKIDTTPRSVEIVVTVPVGGVATAELELG